MKNSIAIVGDFTTEKALEWKDKLNKLAKSWESLEVDLTKVTDADIVGVNALVTSHKILSERGQSISVIFKRGSRMAEMLHLTKFKYILNSTES
jgi:anti-anti-sigma regulatory factor